MPGPSRRAWSGGAWDREVVRFLRAKSAEDSPGDRWLLRMGWELRRFRRLLGRAGVTALPRSLREVTADHVVALRTHLPWEKATFSIHFAALKQFLRWGKNPIAEMKRIWRLPSGAPGHRRWLTRDQLERLFQAAEGRERLLVALEALNGLRRVEVLRLRRKDVRFEEGTISVLGKGRFGGKWRNIPMHPAVNLLLQAGVGGLAEDSRIFPLSASGADLLLERAAVRAGFRTEGVRVSHHDLRRTFGRIAHASGMDLVQLKNMLGHTSVEMTVHYIGLDAERMRTGLTRMSIESPPGRSPAIEARLSG